MKVYKYTDKGGLKILSDLTIKAAPATAFNDPFELTPAIPLEQFSVERVKRAHEHPYAKEQNRKYLQEMGFDLGDDLFESMWSLALPDMVGKAMRELPKSVESVREEFAALFSKYFRIFCTTLCHDSILMWFHFADCHRGFVVELDLDKEFLADANIHFRCFKVRYNDQKAVFDTSDPLSRSKLAECLERVVSTKARAWKYEKEFRFVMPALTGGTDLYRIKPDAISKVIVGARSDQIVEEVRHHLERPELAHVILEKAEVSGSHYRLDFRKVRRQACNSPLTEKSPSGLAWLDQRPTRLSSARADSDVDPCPVADAPSAKWKPPAGIGRCCGGCGDARILRRGPSNRVDRLGSGPGAGRSSQRSSGREELVIASWDGSKEPVRLPDRQG